MRNSLIAAGLMIVPLLIAAAISYWPFRDAGPPISSLAILPTKVYGPADLAYLADEVPMTISTNLAGVEGLDVRTPPNANDYGASVVVLSAITVDAGIYELDLQVIEPRTRRVVWRNSYQSPRGLYPEMLRAASDGLRRAVQPRG